MNDTHDYKRLSISASAVFLRHGDECLMLKRGMHKTYDPGLMNGVGGKLDAGEDFLTAAIRETKEQSGYILQSNQLFFSGLIRVDGLPEDWIIAYFTAQVRSKEIPAGNNTEDGELLWIPVTKVLSGRYEIVSGIAKIFDNIMDESSIFFGHLHCEGINNVVSVDMQKIRL